MLGAESINVSLSVTDIHRQRLLQLFVCTLHDIRSLDCLRNHWRLRWIWAYSNQYHYRRDRGEVSQESQQTTPENSRPSE